MPRQTPTIICVALNPCWDRTLEVAGLKIGRHQRGRLLSVQPAGKAVNVARLLDALGTPSVLTGFVGAGDRDRFADSFAKTSVRLELFEAAGRTRENVTLVDPDRKADTHIRDAGAPLAEEDLAHLTKKLGILAGKGAYVLFTGSLTPGMDVKTFAGLLRVCCEKGARVAVDSSGPGLEAVGRAKDLWLVKPNRDELAEMTGAPADSDADIRTAAETLRPGIDEVAVTLGAEGAMVFAREGAWRAKPHTDPDAVVNTVGAGDAFLAGYVHHHARGEPPEACLRHAVACGTAATRQLPAGRVNPSDVEAALKRVEVEPLA